jgi:hypothetical protein
MPSFGVSPAQARKPVVLGPLLTQSGLQYWYLACFPDCLVALRQGMGAVFVLGMANDDGVSVPILPVLAWILINKLLKPKAMAYRRRAEVMAEKMPTSRLREKPNVVYDIAQLQTIQCKSKWGAPLVLPELILETKNGSKQTFGIRLSEFKKACQFLPQMYPTLCRLM